MDLPGVGGLLDVKSLQLRTDKSPVYAGLFIFKKKGVKMKRVLTVTERLSLFVALAELEREPIEKDKTFEILLRCSYEPVFWKDHKRDNRKWYDFKRNKKKYP